MSKRLKLSDDADGAGSRDGGGGHDVVWFLYGAAPLTLSEISRKKNITHLRIDPSVKVIGTAFSYCSKLVGVEFCEGLQQIEKDAFRECKSLQRMAIPSSVKSFGKYAFFNCICLIEIKFLGGLKRISHGLFERCISLPHIKLPSSVKIIDTWAFCDCRQLMTVELYKGVEKIDMATFKHCSSLRNIAFPGGAQTVQCFEGCHDLLRLFGSLRLIDDGLKSRFDGLPIHKLCYYQSYYPTEEAIEQLNNTGPLSDGNESSLSEDLTSIQDCLGMTPLHILACSATQNLDLCQLIIEKYPDS